MNKIILCLISTLCFFGMASSSQALSITITSPIALATSEEGNAKVTEFYNEQDAHALAEMVESGEAMLLTVGTIIVWPKENDYHNDCVAVHVKGSSIVLYITPDGLRSSTNFTKLTSK
jgi:hypothetical protein